MLSCECFFFKQKTAYEMRISDWSSDVCSSDLPPPQMVANMRIGNVDGYCVGEPWNARAIIDKLGFSAATSQDIWPDHPEKVLGTRSEFVQRDRKSVVSGKSVSVRVDLGGRRIIKDNNCRVSQKYPRPNH